MREADPELTAGERAGERAAFNTIVRAGGEIVGKLASLFLFAVLGRQLGEEGLGVYVFGLAYGAVVLIPVDLGFDRSLLREVATTHARGRALMVKVVRWKLAIAVPAVLVAELVLRLIDVSAETQTVVRVLLAGLLIESLGRTAAHVLMAVERGGLVSIGIVAQRILASAIGVVAVLAGHGVVAAAWAYVAGAAVGTAVTFALLLRRVALPRVDDSAAARDLLDGTATFAVQDVATLLLFRLDAILLAAMATTAAVGRYGAAYRVFESTWFIPVAIAGAFLAMFSYLDRDSEPTLQSVFARGLKITLVALIPCGVAFGTGSAAIIDAIFGAKLDDAARSLEILAPAVVMLGVATLSTGLLMQQRRARPVLYVSLVAVAVNAALNVALIPSLTDRGAAIAMLVTEVLLAGVALAICDRLLGGLDWGTVASGPAAGGLAMALAVVALGGSLPALAAGSVLYFLVLGLVESRVNPDDARYIMALLRRRLRPHAAA